MQSKLPQADFRARRRQLASQLPPNSIAVISGAHEIIRNGDSHYRFRQDSHFYYLTGFDEPDALLVITSGMQSQSILFNRPRMALEEQWTGPRLGQEEAVHVLGVDAAYPYASIETMLLELLIGVTQIFYPIGQNPVHQRCLLDAWLQIKGLSRRGLLAPHALVDLTPLLSEMRLIKDDIELTLMRKAAQGSVAAHLRAMRSVRHSPYEYSLLAEFYDEMLSLGLLSVAYEPIVAGGERACVLHYTANNQPLNAGDLVLVDAGAECGYYAADITRSYPISGRFSTEQRLIYSLVLDAQAAG
ncbi:MAG: Xaa-Pro aminopeptidase, partial [Legionella sp. 21-45-4]